ncbi:hypothetical protein TNCV_1280251 [Trichonephila clavipes]|nr:hypothetical protein TNCV_1280251 [Trichonephila clavipes]
MVSPAGQGQVRHPSIVPEFLRSTSCGMTGARGHGAIVYCLNSGSEGFVKGLLETGDVMDKCVQMWTRNYGVLGQTARCVLACYAPIGRRRRSRETLGRKKEVETRKERSGEKGQESGRENGRKKEERRKRERRLKESRGQRE